MKKYILYMIVSFLCVALFGCGKKSNPINAYYYLVEDSISLSTQDSHNDYIKDINLPSHYDLRELGVVTPVKNQNPWNTCWGFAAIAAAETSILSSLNKTYDQTKLDLSEKHLIWFSKSHVIDRDDSQYGEGLYYNACDSYDSGGFTYTATSIFSSGTGVISESIVPYQGNNQKINDNQNCYSKDDDWSVDEKYRYIQEYKLVDSNVLPCPAKRNEQGDYAGYSAYATDCIKKELLLGRAVSICYHSEKGNETEGLKYLNTKNNSWTHYTFDDAPYSHSVTIVGYDDNIPKESFINHSKENKNGNPYYPEGDGAWIVKNSWGAEDQSFPNNGVWGVRNNDGIATGYFYLSYYDHSLYGPESFIFEPSIDEDEYIINQYDFLQSKSTKSVYSNDEVKTANVFENGIDKIIKAISIETCNENTNVKIQLFLLNNDYKNPEDGKLLYEDNCYFDYAGYHKIDLNKDIPINVNEIVSVVVTQTVNINELTYYEIFVDTQLKKDDGVDRAKGVVNKKESYLYIKDNESWYDWSDVVDLFNNEEQLGNYVYDNFPIKIYSSFK